MAIESDIVHSRANSHGSSPKRSRTDRTNRLDEGEHSSGELANRETAMFDAADDLRSNNR
jgi:hypothetical protein